MKRLCLTVLAVIAYSGLWGCSDDEGEGGGLLKMG